MMRAKSNPSPLKEVKPESSRTTASFFNMPSGVISPAQLRAARGLLNWGRTDCAEASGLSPETIKNIEHDNFTPTEATSKSLLVAFAAHNVEFINLVHFSLNTLSGHDLSHAVNVSGAVLVLPHAQEPDAEPSS